MTAGEFLAQTRGSFEYLTCRALSSVGIEHGFIGKSADFSDQGIDESAKRFLDEFGVSKLVLLKQVHGNQVAAYDWNSEQGTPVADGILVARQPSARRQRVAFGIRVADCLSIFLIAPHAVALVHAGWRGLAQGIHIDALKGVSGNDTNKQIQAVYWPCAGLNKYEVGPEVIAPFGTQAVASPLTDGKFLFGIRETAHRALCAAGVDCDQSYVSPQCTIEDPSLHSYRRDGELSGRNLAFLLL